MDLLAQALNQLAPKNVGIVEFSESSDFCNRPLYPAQAVLLKTIFLEELTGPEEDILSYWIEGGRNGTEIAISPNVRERVGWLREAGYPHFREIALVGGRRSSKGFCTGLAMAKVMWSTLQLQDPGAHYGIDPEKEIYFSCIAGSQEQSQGRQYADFSSTVETCKAFDPYIVKSLETEIRVATNVDLRRIAQEKGRGNRIQKDIARLRGNAMAANSGTIRGLAMMCYAIDEIAHMLPGESKSSPNKIYEAANPSLGQFGVDGLAFLNSSPYTKIGLFYEKYVEALLPFDPTGAVDEPISVLDDGIDLNRNGEPRLLVLQFPSWALYEGYQKSKNRAKLKSALMGSPDWDLDEKDEKGESLWTDKDKQLARTARAEEQANPEGFKVEYRGKFAEVMDAYMEPRRIDEMFAGLPHEWVYDEASDTPDIPRLKLIPFKTNMGADATNLFRYKFHLDPSSTTAGFGFAIAHTETIADWRGVEEEHVIFDLIKRWQPQKFPGKVIRWPTILEEVMKYAEYFFPFEITMDQHESSQPIQELQEKLNERNIPTRVYLKNATAELNWHRWEVCKTSIYAKLVHAPNDTEDARWCSQELKFLQIQGGTSKFPRVDRQEIGPVQTKDEADPLRPDHEVLTIDGWKSIGAVTTQDLVAGRDEYGKMVYCHPLKTIERYVNEDLYTYEGPTLNFSVTGTHNMLVAKKGGCELVQARHLVGVSKIPKTALVERKGPEIFSLLDAVEPKIESISPDPISYGRCHCGCNQFTPVASRTRNERGETKGKPVAFMPRHSRKWRVSEDYFLDTNYSDTSMQIITQTLGRSRGAIYGRARVRELDRGQISDRVRDRPVPLPQCRTIDFAAFVGFWLGDGKKIQRDRGKSTGYIVKISQTKSSGIRWMDELMSRLGWPYERKICSNGETEWIVKSYELREYLLALQDNHELRLPPETWNSWGTEALTALLDGLIESDGTRTEKGEERFCNSSLRLIEDVQRLAMHLGRRGSPILQNHQAGEQVIIRDQQTKANRDVWTLCVSDVRPFATLRATEIKQEPYSGSVFCLTMPTSNFLTRRKGIPMWIGNCVAECVNTLIGNQISNRTRERLSSSAVLGGAEGGYGIGFSGTGLRPGGAPPNLETYTFSKERKAQQEFQSPTRGALGRGRGRRGSNRARW